MFTGIVEEKGRLRERVGDRFTFEAPTVAEGLKVGESVAVDGCCLTVVAFGPGWWEAEAVSETLSRTTLGLLSPGVEVNLERALRLDDRLGGHIVGGHVDGVGTVVEPAPDLSIALPERLRRYVVEKGSVAVDGVSLTVASTTGEGFAAAIVPHTARVTTLGRRRAGDPVNVEVDILARYAERLLRD